MIKDFATMQPNIAKGTTELSTRIDRLALQSVKRDLVCHRAFALLDGFRNDSGELLAAGAAVLFAAVCERVELDPEELYRLGSRLLHEPDAFHHKENSSVESLRDFAALRVRNNPII